MSRSNSEVSSGKALPSFENPPVIEVVCGILFKSLDDFSLPYIGQLWEKFKPDYPSCQEAPPLMAKIEQFGELPPTEIEFATDLPIPRVWFVHEHGNAVIQIQRDRFLYNWRKAKHDDEYPRYETVKELFRRHLSTFKSFLDEASLGGIIPRQYEMTYINHIPQGEGWNSDEEAAKVFPDFAWRSKRGRFLPNPEAVNIQTNFPLPEKMGRLHATIRTANRRSDSRPMLMLELTARGMPKDASVEKMWQWFDLAREWIVRGFADLTGEEIQEKVWRRTT